MDAGAPAGSVVCMAAQTKAGQVEAWYEKQKKKFDGIKERLKEHAEVAKHIGLQVAALVEVNAMAFAFGFIRGFYNKEFRFLSLPVEAWVGIALHGLGTYLDLTAARGPAGEWQRIFGEQLHNLGNGSFAAYFTTLGAQIGTEMREENPQGAKVAGPMQLNGGHAVGALPERHAFGPPVSEAELQRASAV